MKIRKVIIPAAGLGSRFLPLTKVVPKELLPLGPFPAIHYVVEEAKLAAVHDFYLVTNRHKAALFDYFSLDDGLLPNLKGGHQHPSLTALRQLVADLRFFEVEQRLPKGLGDAILTGADAVSNDDGFAVMLPDDILVHSESNLKLMIEIAAKSGKGVVGLQEVSENLVSSYGIASVEVNSLDKLGYYNVNSLVEKPVKSEAPSNLAVVGRYVLPVRIMDYLRTTAPGKNGEIQLTDALNVLAQEGELIGFPLRGDRLDVGTPHGLMEANLFLSARRDPNALGWLDAVVNSAKKHLKEG